MATETLYQCPYEPASKCAMTEPCNGCETWAEALNGGKVCVSNSSDLLCALRDVAEYAARNCCLHDETHRGGAIWEICDMCGAKWADDEGGMPPGAREYPKEIKTAFDVLGKFSA